MTVRIDRAGSAEVLLQVREAIAIGITGGAGDCIGSRTVAAEILRAPGIGYTVTNAIDPPCGDDIVRHGIGAASKWTTDNQRDRIGMHEAIGMRNKGSEQVSGCAIPEIPKPIRDRTGRCISKGYRERSHAVRGRRRKRRDCWKVRDRNA